MNRNKIIELAKKINALAEKGKDGERNAAKEKLEKIRKKYNILDSELKNEQNVKEYFIPIKDGNERDLLINICCMILDVPGFKWKERNDCICLKVSQSEYQDIISAFEYYKEMYDDYKRYIVQAMISRNMIGYIPKHQTYTQENIQQDIFPTSKSEDVKNEETHQKTEGNSTNSENRNETSEDIAEDVFNPIDPIKLMKIAVALDKRPWTKPLPYNKLIE